MLDANAMTQIRIVRGADGHRYIHDPNFALHWATHVHIPQHTDYLSTDYSGGGGLGDAARRDERRADRRWERRSARREEWGAHRRQNPAWHHYRFEIGKPMFPRWQEYGGGRNLNGLGAITPLEQGATMALNFIPGVGPILSGVASLVEGLLGGGDPTPEWKLEEEVLQLRDAIAQAHQTLGIPDSFHLNGPIGGGANNPEPLRSAVTEALGHPGSGPTWRSDLYTAIHNLQGELQGISQQANNHEVVQQVLAALQQSAVVPTTQPTNATADQGAPGDGAPAPALPSAGDSFAQEAQQYGPYVLGSVGALAVIFLMASMIGGGSKTT